MFFCLILMVCFVQTSFACTVETVNKIVSTIDPFREKSIQLNFTNAIESLSLCDENLFYAGKELGRSFDPFRVESTFIMSKVVIQEAGNINNELAYGLGLGLIGNLDLFRHNSTVYMLNAIIELARSNVGIAKEYALETMKKSDPFREQSNRELMKAVKILRELAQPPVLPPETPSSIWSFRSEDRVCKTIPGPWGYYYPCPKYTASIVDNRGNRLILTCSSNEYGINFRIRPSRELWNNIWSSTVESISFGTDKITQQMGLPYLINDDTAVHVEEPISEELLERLKADKVLNIKMRLNSGESSANLTYKLTGSNKAITTLMSYCQ